MFGSGAAGCGAAAGCGGCGGTGSAFRFFTASCLTANNSSATSSLMAEAAGAAAAVLTLLAPGVRIQHADSVSRKHVGSISVPGQGQRRL